MAEKRAELSAALTYAAQRSATDGIVLHQLIADRVGLHVTDLRCLNTLRVTGSATAGELAAQTGLTTGAITRMIDRLLKSGFVRREHDARDRRRVIITAVPERIAEIGRHYEVFPREFAQTTADYTVEQLELILDLFNRLHETSLRVAEILREDG